MARTYSHDDREKPSVTTVISACTAKPALIQWAANQCVSWIRDREYYSLDAAGLHMVDDSELDEMRYAHKKYGIEAMEIGSEVHTWIEKFLKKRQ